MKPWSVGLVVLLVTSGCMKLEEKSMGGISVNITRLGSHEAQQSPSLATRAATSSQCIWSFSKIIIPKGDTIEVDLRIKGSDFSDIVIFNTYEVIGSSNTVPVAEDCPGNQTYCKIQYETKEVPSGSDRSVYFKYFGMPSKSTFCEAALTGITVNPSQATDAGTLDIVFTN